MGRIRTIKPEFFKHSGLFDLEQQTELPTRLAFAGLFTCCDREGRFKWRPRELKIDVLPYDECDFERVLDALASRGFIVKYASGDQFFGYIPTWHRHQFVNNKESASTLPNPSIEQQLDARLARDSREDNALGTPSVKEGKGKEEELEGKGNARVRNTRIVQPPSPGANGEFMLAQELMREIKLAGRVGDIALVGQVIANESEEHGGPLQAKDFIRDKAKDAMARGERVTIFWLQDRNFAQGKPVSERDRKKAQFMAETEEEYGETA